MYYTPQFKFSVPSGVSSNSKYMLQKIMTKRHLTHKEGTVSRRAVFIIGGEGGYSIQIPKSLEQLVCH
jgi:hypothetical protein